MWVVLMMRNGRMDGGGGEYCLGDSKFQGKRKGLKKLSLHRPLPMANDLKWRFRVLRKKWNKEFGHLSKEERERPACNDKIKALTQEMVKVN